MASTPLVAFSAAILAAVSIAGCSKVAQTTSVAVPASPVALGDVRRGAETFAATCSACHGSGGLGGVGPSLVGEKHRKNYTATLAWIEQPAPPMPKLYPAPLSLEDVENVATYVQSL
jgi:mono/diheme cytochrome c family protein